MRIFLSALSVALSFFLCHYFFGPPKCPLDVFITLILVMWSAFGASLAIRLAFGYRSLERFAGMDSAIFNYSFGTMLPIMMFPVISIRFEDYGLVLYPGIVFIMITTVWFNHFATPKKK